MIKVLNQYVPRQLLPMLIGENLLILAAVAAAMNWQGATEPSIAAFQPVLWRALAIALLFQLCLHFSDFYDLRRLKPRILMFVRMVQGIGTASLILAALYLCVPELRLARGLAFSTVLIVMGVLPVWRLAAESFSMVHRAERCLLVGSGSCAREIAAELGQRKDLRLDLVGIVEDLPADDGGQMRGGPSAGADDGTGREAAPAPILGRLAHLERFIDMTAPDRIVVALRERRQQLPLGTLLCARSRGIRVEEGADLYEKISGRLPIESIRPSWLIFSRGFGMSSSKRFQRRAVGMVGAAAALLLFSPVMALVALAVRLESPGPVLFTQDRVGGHGRVFTLFKFRSMRADAEAASGPVWARIDDPRITRVGKWLRRLRLDELPQLFNVLRGDMNFVGPRPERPAFVERLKEAIPYYDLRHSVPPGVTGWAQVSAPYGASVEAAKTKLEYDLFYIKNVSLSLDLFVLFQTVKTVVLGRGAR